MPELVTHVSYHRLIEIYQLRKKREERERNPEAA